MSPDTSNHPSNHRKEPTMTSEVDTEELPEETEEQARFRFARELADSYRALADHIESRPTLAACMRWQVRQQVAYTDKAEVLPYLVAEMGSCEKYADDWSIGATRKFGEHLILKAQATRTAVCERIEVGTKTVTKMLPPEGVELVATQVDEPVYEWSCPPSFLGMGDEKAKANPDAS